LVLDEWAADQDPQFRRLFYTYLLPELKRRGITIIAITHDDRYFHTADRIPTMDNGQLQELDNQHHAHDAVSLTSHRLIHDVTPEKNQPRNVQWHSPGSPGVIACALRFPATLYRDINARRTSGFGRNHT